MAAKSRIHRVLLDWDEESRVWVTYVPELGNISTYGDTEEEALAATREMISVTSKPRRKRTSSRTP